MYVFLYHLVVYFWSNLSILATRDRATVRPRLDEPKENKKGKQKAKVTANNSDDSDVFDESTQPFDLPRFLPSEKRIFWDSEDPLEFLKTNCEYSNCFTSPKYTV